MSRAMNLTSTKAEVVAACHSLNVATTAIEALIPSGTRVVCQSSDGALALRKKMKSQIISGKVTREPLSVVPGSRRF